MYESLLKPLSGILSVFQRERHYQSEQSSKVKQEKKEALEAIFHALIETKKYVEHSRLDRDEEFRIAELWAIASIRAKKSVESIDDVAYAKFRYWFDGLRWDRETRVERGIELNKVEKQIKELLEEL